LKGLIIIAEINISNLTFAYDGSYENVFENVNLSIDTNWKLGLSGRNGRGKTTLLRLLEGRLTCRGKITAPCDFTYFPFDADKARLTKSVISDFGHFADWKLARELNLLEVAEDVLHRPFGTLSGGEQTKVMLAALFLRENNFLLIDEPTNHLDIHGRELVSRYLSGKSGFILVSHDRYFLDGCIDYILSINKANIEVTRGSFSAWLENKRRQDSFELAENQKLKREIGRLEKTAREKAEWSGKLEKTKIGTGAYDRGFIGAQAARMMKKAKAIEGRQQRAIEEKSKLLKNIETADDLKIFPQKYHAKTLVRLRDVSIFYGDKAACENITFNIEAGDRIALCGPNGSGKSSIIKLICGENLQHTGEMHMGSGLQISYISQDTSYLKGTLWDFCRDEGLDASLMLAMLRKLDFSREQFDIAMQNFSAGQKKKVLIAKSLMEKAHLLIWDEPLNYIDILSRIQIENLILRYCPTILFVEHDGAFLDKVATSRIDLN
jgi:lincosamide and streptogramin A transport system ATP-binding/permease protein